MDMVCRVIFEGDLLPEPGRKTWKAVEEGGFWQNPGELNGFEVG
jgi:hypothetical protein